MSVDLVIIGCGRRKLDHPARACDLYTGPYFGVCLNYARHIAGGQDERILILSAKYGLLRLDREVAPYNLLITQPGAVTVTTLRAQAASLGVLRRLNVVGLCGKHYAAKVRAVWPTARFPLPTVKMGPQMSWMNRQMAGEGWR